MAIEVNVLKENFVDVSVYDQDPVEVEVGIGTTYMSPFLEDIIQKEDVIMIIDCGTSTKNI